MIVEVRTYTIVPGFRQRFLYLFETRTRPLQESLGIGVIGPWLDVENRDRFVWLRSFPSWQERERMKEALYEGPEWTGELEAIMMPLLADYSSIQVEMDADELARFQPSNRWGSQ